MRDDGQVDADRTRLLMELLEGTGWVNAARTFAGTLRRTTATGAGDLLLVGTPNFEPWHFAAHLGDEAQFAGLPELTPVLVRWQVPASAPSHLAVPLQRLEIAGRGETVLVVTDELAPEPLLERTWDARRAGATVLTLDHGSTELAEIAHDGLVVPDTQGELLSFDSAQHIVSIAAGEAPTGRVAGRLAGAPVGRAGLRSRLARLLDTISGPPADGSQI